MIKETAILLKNGRKKEEKECMSGKWIGVLLASVLFISGCGIEDNRADISDVSESESETSSQVQAYDCTGQWEMTGANQNGLGITLEKAQEELGGSMSFTLKKDGSFYAQIDNASVDGLWYQDENKIQLIMSNGESVDMKANDDTITMEWENMTLIFEKEQDKEE